MNPFTVLWRWATARLARPRPVPQAAAAPVVPVQRCLASGGDCGWCATTCGALPARADAAH